MQHGVVAGAAAELVQSLRLTSSADDPEAWQASAPVSCPAASRGLAACLGLAACQDLAASQGQAACLGLAAGDWGDRAVGSPAAGVVAAVVADAAADWDARQAAWVAAAADAA
jgi:hypothetical protein